MNVLLIWPPSSDKRIRAEVSAQVEKEAGVYPSLGILYIAAYLEKTGGHKVRVLDGKLEPIDATRLAEVVKREGPGIVGITALSFNLLEALEVARIIKGLDSRIPICLGGPHVSIYPLETLKLANVDLVVVGEGEIAFSQLVEAISRGQDLADIPGIGYYRDGVPTLNPGKNYIDNLDILPVPARHLIDMTKCYSLLGKAKTMITIQSTRGCPYQCIYCDQQQGKKLRKRSLENLLAEIESIVALGFDDLFFIDDLFTTDRKRVVAFCEQVLKRNLKINFKISARVNLVDREMLLMLKKAGCYRIHYGVESGDQQVLDSLRKGITLEQIERAIRYSKEAGIDSLAYFMIGNPGETRRQVLETIDFACRLNPTYAQFSVTTPYPDTELYRRGLEQGIFARDFWREYAENPRPDFSPPLWTAHLSEAELLRLVDLAHRRFYFRPTYIVNEFLRTRSPGEFKNKFKAACRLLFAH
jgi:radical SAM superfamily enzyme YgiQ (UPF0313 family)